jgi:hypothetical protein
LPNTAQRVNAGVLLQAEQSAELPKAPPPAPPVVPAPAAAPQPAAKKPSPGIAPIETYQGDIEGLVQSKNVSVLTIAAAEAARRGAAAGAAAEAPQAPSVDIMQWLKRGGMVAAGVVLIALAAGAVAWVLQPPRAVEVQDVVAAVPFIQVDASKQLSVPDTAVSHRTFIDALVGQRDSVSLSLGLMEALLLGTASSTAQGRVFVPLSAGTLLTYLSPSVPSSLVRSVSPSSYLLGVHSYDGNQPFLILKADSYEGAYAGMLAWEQAMPSEMRSLFVRVPPVLIRNDPAPSVPAAPSTATSTATSTPAGTASSTVATTSAPAPSPSLPVPALPPKFIDKIVENHDARVIENADHQILLLWAFANRNVLVITTNEATFREVLSRLETAPIVPTP